MKKYILTIAALVLGISQMSAQKLIIEDVDLPKGGQVTLTVKYETGGESLTTASFSLALPDGVSSEKNSAGKSKFVVNSAMAESFTAFTTADDGYSVAATATGVEFPGTEGDLGTITLFAAEDAENLVIGESYPVTVSKLSLTKRTDAGLVSVYFDDFTFNVNIVDNIVTLDENSTTAPEAAENVKVKVLRTIKANNWSTICLPFAMTAEQLAEKFGDDVELAELSDHEIEEDGEDIAAIRVYFSNVEELEANYPYIIKTSNDVEEFTLEGVTIEPEEDPCMEMDNGKTGSRRVVYRGMYGTYVANTVVPEFALFLSGNDFWYSKGNTKMKAFRAYIELGGDVVTAVENGAKFSILVDGEATSIDGFGTQRTAEGVYDLSGRKIRVENNDLNTLQKGVYIIDGKKVTIK